MKENNISLANKKILITGVAGFIGSNLVIKIVQSIKYAHIIGIDNLNDYYDIKIKKYRLKRIEASVGRFSGIKWSFIHDTIDNSNAVDTIFEIYKPDIVINLLLRKQVFDILLQIPMLISSQIS